MSENEIVNQDSEQNTPSTEERNIVVIGILASIFLIFIPALIIYLVYGKDKLSPLSYKSTVNLLNFEIYLILITVALNIIGPFLLFLPNLVALALWVANLIICVKAFQAFDKGEEYKYPLQAPFIK